MPTSQSGLPQVAPGFSPFSGVANSSGPMLSSGPGSIVVFLRAWLARPVCLFIYSIILLSGYLFCTPALKLLLHLNPFWSRLQENVQLVIVTDRDNQIQN